MKTLKPLTDNQYEKYLDKDENFEKVIKMWDALLDGRLQVADLNYFLYSDLWEGSPSDNNLVTTFFIPYTIPQQSIHLEFDKDIKVLKLVKSNFLFGDYDIQLNINIKKKLIPLLENGIIKISDKE